MVVPGGDYVEGYLTQLGFVDFRRVIAIHLRLQRPQSPLHPLEENGVELRKHHRVDRRGARSEVEVHGGGGPEL